ncbi:MAG: tetratricopeptide repeat protein [Candidatus Kariarchaeaceae archaeon]|jgi:tetratricopeptide (TPR) repeat protein
MSVLQLKNLINQGKLELAKDEIAALSPENSITGRMYLAVIEIQDANIPTAKTIIEELLISSRSNENWFQEYMAICIKSLVEILSHNLDEAQRAIEQAELIQNLLNGDEKLDREYWDAMLELSKSVVSFENNNFDVSLIHSLASLKFFQMQKSAFFTKWILRIIGETYYSLGKHNLALSYFLENLSLIKDAKSENLHAQLNEFIGNVHFAKGQYDLAYYYLNEAIALQHALNDSTGVARNEQLLGKIHLNTGNFDRAFEHFQKSTDIQESLGDKLGSNWSQLQVALARFKQGEFLEALDIYEKCKENFKELNDKLMSAWTIKSIGEIYVRQGEYKTALTYFEENIQILTELNNKFGLADGLNKIGEVYYHQNEINKALDYFQRSFSLYIKIGDDIQAVDTIFNLVQVKLEKKAYNQAKHFLTMLRERTERTQNKYVKLKYKLANALYLKHHQRIIQKIEAQKIFEEIVSEDIVDHQITIIATLNLCELLLAELRSYEYKEVIQELKYHLGELYEIAQEQKSFNLLVEVLVMQAKLALIEGDADRGFNFLMQAEITIADYGLHQLSSKVKNQQHDLKNKVELWNELDRRNAPIRERLDLADIDGYLEKVFKDTNQK